jgi:hypothetical protein
MKTPISQEIEETIETQFLNFLKTDTHTHTHTESLLQKIAERHTRKENVDIRSTQQAIW